MKEQADLVATLRAAGCVYAEQEAELLVEAAAGTGELDTMVSRRVAGLPLEQVVGWAEFCGLRLVVEPGVFVPRRRTQVLAGEAVRLVRRTARRPVAVDLCCGVGAVAAVLADAVEDIELYASDVDPAAVRCARLNLADRALVLQGDLDRPLPDGLRGRVDVLTANVPYVPTEEIVLLPAEAREHEPRVALDGGVDGLRVLARVAHIAPRLLAPGGSVLVETSERQAAAALDLLRGEGLRARTVVDDDLVATVVVGTAPSAPSPQPEDLPAE